MTSIKDLDLVYLSSTYRDVSNIETIVVEKDSYYGMAGVEFNVGCIGFQPYDLKVFGTNCLNGVLGYPTPVMSFGDIVKTKNDDITSYRGLIPTRIENETLFISEDWFSRIDVRQDGTAFIYTGHGGSPDERECLIFPYTVNFDPKKQLVFARSPNNSISFKHTITWNNLGEIELEEPIDYRKGFYHNLGILNEIYSTIILNESSPTEELDKISKIMKGSYNIDKDRTKQYFLIYKDMTEYVRGKRWMRLIID